MGGQQSKSYESKDAQILQHAGLQDKGKQNVLSNMVSKRDGTIMPSKEQICKNYDESLLPWPLKPLIKLDYCWRLNYMMWKHSVYLAVPMTFIHFIYTQMPQCWTYDRKTFPKLLFTINYCACVLVIAGINVTWSLLFEDYW